ncbi:hypothetical protein AB835_04045 [Candidatus Endobugula sertula]|uniref:PKD domain-containing protein n=1 Tax=Candidatus Endobugula sertula TaxID=62101 RepID=A0A1D2QS30_9GAMM|nr:hypothetical protein AB835_04045 [Candidatus Endobugula sertula]
MNGRYQQRQPIGWLFILIGLMLPMTQAQASWWNPRFDVTIETTTNGVDADSPPGSELLLGTPITWTYTVTNTGRRTLQRVDVYDRAPDPNSWWSGRLTKVCTLRRLKRDESQRCTLEGTAKEGQYRNTGIAVAHGRRWWQWDRDVDRSHYLGTLGNPSIDLEKTTQGQDADVAPGPELFVDDTVSWLFSVTNTGDVDLTNVVITDEQVQPTTTSATIVCEIDTLAIGQTQTCHTSGTVIEGQYQNVGKVTAQGHGSSVVNDEDSSYYNGVSVNPLAALPSAIPSSGGAPLTVIFTPNATTSNAIIRYEWDFEGNGSYDRSETVGRDQSFTYNTPGTYNATLRVTDNQGEQAPRVW